MEKEARLERLALVARLKLGTQARAEELIGKGTPFDPLQIGFVRHSVFLSVRHGVFLSATEVVFVFEAHEIEWLVTALVEDPFQWMMFVDFAAFAVERSVHRVQDGPLEVVGRA